MRLPCLALTVLSIVPLSTLVAQQPPPIEVVQRVRITQCPPVIARGVHEEPIANRVWGLSRLVQPKP
jgi:hypothetical protein